MTEPTHGAYDVSEVDGIDTLKDRLAKANGIKDLSFILDDYISWGNNKIDKSVAIFNMNSATDCPNAQTDNCQVPWKECYAHKAENQYKQTLPYRRRQEYLWDSLSAFEWAAAFKCIVSRKRNDVTAIRFSEAGDFRNESDIMKVDRIAQMLSTDGIDVYTYSASDYLNWSHAEHFNVMQSNDKRDYGNNLYTAVPTEDDIPEDAVQCAYEGAEIKCGDCTMCINQDFDKDVYITLH